ncbi:MAG: hypothetical protein ACUVRA_01825 [Candidatus Bathyarchaeaceae archaeon]
MNQIHIIRNEDVDKVLIGVPEGHKHIRVCIKLKNGLALVFQESTIANILRAYITVKTHPRVRTRELQMKTLAAELRKDGYAAHQLLEVPRKNEDIERELKSFLEKGRTCDNHT